jgi:type IV secretory pathway VirB10-like protein
VSDQSHSQTAKLPPPPIVAATDQPPPPAGAPVPPPPPGATPGIPAPPAPPASNGAPARPVAPPVGPPRFPIPGRRKADQAPKPKGTPEEAAREAEQREEESAELIAQRDRLLEKFTVMQADLGGAFYEMAIRDHVRLDVLTRKAAELQRVDAELLAVERVLELERADAAGLCPGCGAPYGHAVRFCAQCGTPLVPTEGGA